MYLQARSRSVVEGVSGARQEGNKFGIKVLKCESDENKEEKQL